MHSATYAVVPLIISFSVSAFAIPLASPETFGAGSDCGKPTITGSDMDKLKQGPWLVSVVRADASPMVNECWCLTTSKC